MSLPPCPDEHREIDLHLFLPPRLDRQRDSDFLDRLGQSLLTQGAMHPVRCIRELTDGREMYRTLTGWSKVLAGRRVGIRTLPALVLSRPLTETETILDWLVENDLRAETEEQDKYRAYVRLRELNEWTLAEIARACHTSSSEVTKTFARCEKLPPELVALIGTGEGKLCPRAAYCLSRLHPDADKQRGLAEKYLGGLLKVERLEEHVARLLGGGKGKRPKPLKGRTPGGVGYMLPPDDLEAAHAEVLLLAKAIKKAMDLGLPGSSVQSLLKNTG